MDSDSSNTPPSCNQKKKKKEEEEEEKKKKKSWKGLVGTLFIETLLLGLKSDLTHAINSLWLQETNCFFEQFSISR